MRSPELPRRLGALLPLLAWTDTEWGPVLMESAWLDRCPAEARS